MQKLLCISMLFSYVLSAVDINVTSRDNFWSDEYCKVDKTHLLCKLNVRGQNFCSHRIKHHLTDRIPLFPNREAHIRFNWIRSYVAQGSSPKGNLLGGSCVIADMRYMVGFC